MVGAPQHGQGLADLLLQLNATERASLFELVKENLDQVI
jgi:hypothetical protein